MYHANGHSGGDQNQKNDYTSVYIRDDELGWQPAELIECNLEQQVANVLLYPPNTPPIPSILEEMGMGLEESVLIDLTEYPPHFQLPVRNTVDGLLQVADDLVDLTNLHEPGILSNLRHRYEGIDCCPYTRISPRGDILISVNPHQKVKGLYSLSKKRRYADRLVWNSKSGVLPPHIYEISSLAYKGVVYEGEDQAILCLGETGSGKTESVRVLIDHLVNIDASVRMNTSTDQGINRSSSRNDMISSRILMANHLLDSFGNAKTIKNDNSSRFGKVVELQFHIRFPYGALPLCELAGCRLETFMLEKTRVAHMTNYADERSFHIFYQLLAAPEEEKCQFWSELANKKLSSFKYLATARPMNVSAGPTPAERWRATMAGLGMMGLKGDLLKDLICALCCVLQLGNVTFSAGLNENESVITSAEELVKLAELLDVDISMLMSALTIRVTSINGGTSKSPINHIDAKENCDMFAREMYAKIFQWIVDFLNDKSSSLDEPGVDVGKIMLVDMFGHESFCTNRFVQICINHASERMQLHYSEKVFTSVLDKAQFEGFSPGEINFPNNSLDVCSLIEGSKKNKGIIQLLNEESGNPDGCKEGLLKKLYSIYQKQSQSFHSKPLIMSKTYLKSEFAINHTNNPVVYDSSDFIIYNRMTLPNELVKCALNSSNAIIANAFKLSSKAEVAEPSPNKPKKMFMMNRYSPRALPSTDSAWSKFKDHLDNLLGRLDQVDNRYIYCINPNPMKREGLLNTRHTVNQVRCAGLEAITNLSVQVYPDTLLFTEVMDRFRMLALRADDNLRFMSSQHARKDIESMLGGILKRLEVKNPDGTRYPAYRCGKTRVFFRAGALQYLECKERKIYNAGAIMIQSQVRRIIAVEQFHNKRIQSIIIQSSFRKVLAKNRVMQLRKMVNSAIFMQSRIRVWLSLRRRDVRVQEQLNDNAMRIQSIYRLRSSRRHADSLRLIRRDRRISKLQALIRRYLAHKDFFVLRESKLYAIILIQTRFRIMLAIRRCALLRETNQKFYSKFNMEERRRLEMFQILRENCMDRCATEIQCLFRRRVARRRFVILRRHVQNTNAITIQCFMRQKFASKRFARLKRNQMRDFYQDTPQSTPTRLRSSRQKKSSLNFFWK